MNADLFKAEPVVERPKRRKLFGKEFDCRRCGSNGPHVTGLICFLSDADLRAWNDDQVECKKEGLVQHLLSLPSNEARTEQIRTWLKRGIWSAELIEEIHQRAISAYKARAKA